VKNRKFYCGVLAVIFLLNDCSKTKTSLQPIENQQGYINCHISAAGGTYTIEPGFLLTVPAGAVPSDTTVAVEELDLQTMQTLFADYGVADFPAVAGFDVKPAGLTFAKPLTFTFKSLAYATPYIPLIHTVDLTNNTHSLDSGMTALVDNTNDSLSISVVRSGGYIAEALTNWPGGLAKHSAIANCKNGLVKITCIDLAVQCSDQDCEALESRITAQFLSCAGQPVDSIIELENAGKCTGTLTLTPGLSTISTNSSTKINALVTVGCLGVNSQPITWGVSGPAGANVNSASIQTDAAGNASATFSSGSDTGTAVITASANVKYLVRELVIGATTGSEMDTLYRLVPLTTQTAILVAAQACSYSINPSGTSFDSSGGSGTIVVTTGTGCPWTATASNGNWIVVTSGSSGSGPGTIGFSVLANTGPTQRSGQMAVADTSITITQTGSVPATGVTGTWNGTVNLPGAPYTGCNAQTISLAITLAEDANQNITGSTDNGRTITSGHRTGDAITVTLSTMFGSRGPYTWTWDGANTISGSMPYFCYDASTGLLNSEGIETFSVTR
jgi:hypothetical protein